MDLIERIGGGVPVPTTDEARWLIARRRGLGASEVAAALGLSRWRTPYQVWLEKTGRAVAPWSGTDASNLGLALEPWLIQQARGLLETSVVSPTHRLYRHPEHRWRLASPDAVAVAGDAPPLSAELVECKTGGLVTRYVEGWTDEEIPLAYELQCRWQMHVTGLRRVHVAALVAGWGLRLWTVEHDPDTEAELVGQVTDWWDRYVVADAEPPLVAADSAVMAAHWPRASDDVVELDGTDALLAIEAYHDAAEAEKNARGQKDECAAVIKNHLREARAGTLDGREVVTWDTRKGRIDYAQLCADKGIDPEPWRGDATRALIPKKVT